METEPDPRLAFQALQELHGMEVSRLAGDNAAKSAYIHQLKQELAKAEERITALEQNQAAEGNGAKKSGAELKSMEMHPTAPAALRKVKE